MTHASDEFASFVTHPRYGQRPQFTGLNPQPDYLTGEVFLHWHSPPEVRIANTALAADVSRQASATIPVTHYFDSKRQCRDCKRHFIFFAKEQKYWYEELGFGLDSDCVRCTTCRKKQQGLAHARLRYEELFHIASPTVEESLDFVECWLELVDASVFPTRQGTRMRSLLTRLSPQVPQDAEERFLKLSARVASACGP